MTIGQKTIELLQNSKKSYYSILELANYLGIKQTVLKVTLSRLVKQKKLLRITRGYYCLPQKVIDTEQLAVELNYPSYLSLEYALALYGILSQVPTQLTLITPNRSAVHNANGTVLEYTHIKPILFFGYTIVKQTQIAKPEKALLDELYLIGLKKRKLDVRELDLKNIDKNLIHKWIKFYPPSTVNLVKKLAL